MRSILLILLTIFFCLPAFSQEPLKATVTKEWTVDTAREEAFKNVEYTKDLNEYPAIDPNLIENRIAIQNKQDRVGNRRINFFNDNSYSIRKLEEEYFNIEYYYNNNGKLIAIQFDSVPPEINTPDKFFEFINDKKNYPLESYYYEYSDGSLLGVWIKVNTEETYQFKPTGELNSYWNKENGYDSKGNLVIKRLNNPY